MILNTGGRTDTVQYYSEWLLNRFKEGFVYSRNPFYPSKVSRYDLSPDKIDAVIFCSKNYEPILNRLHEITDKFNTYFFYTITAYDKDIEPRVPSIEKSIETLLELEKIVDFKRIAWRYDPILLTDKYTKEYHLKTFENMAKKLSGHIDRCIFSFVEIYKKVKFNMPEIQALTESEKEAIAEGLGKIAERYKIHLQTCATNGDYRNYGIHQSGCITLDIIGRGNNITFRKIKHNGMRKYCNCIESRDIGAYNTCPNGCKYCYANATPQKALENYKLHKKNSPILLGEILKTDLIQQANQNSFIEKNSNLTLF